MKNLKSYTLEIFAALIFLHQLFFGYWEYELNLKLKLIIFLLLISGLFVLAIVRKELAKEITQSEKYFGIFLKNLIKTFFSDQYQSLTLVGKIAWNMVISPAVLFAIITLQAMCVIITFGANAGALGFPFPVFLLEKEIILYQNILKNLALYTFLLTILGEIAHRIKKLSH